MSSTNRGGERRPHDAYNTPSWVTQLLLREVFSPGALVGKTVLDPGAGEGAILAEVMRHEPRAKIVGLEVQSADECPPHPMVAPFVERADFLLSQPRAVDVVIMNPPFKLALEFVKQAILCASTVYALLRHGFTRSESRWSFMHRHLTEINMLPQRPSFVVGAKAQTDSCEYDWLRFDRDQAREIKARLLPCLPRVDRKRW